MKDEFKGEIISEFAVDGREVKKAKGVNKHVVKSIRHEEFVDVLFNKKIMRHNLKRIKSKLDRVGTYDVCNISLSCLGDKR